MEDTLSNQDLDASHTIIGTDSEATAAIRPRREFRAVAACGGLASLAAVVIGAGILIRPPTASAVPSFARQTGQPCAACHTAFPELTPFGRRFKLNGYTLEGGDWKLPPLAAMVQSTFTEYARKLDAPAGNYAPVPPSNGYSNNNMLDLDQQVSLFYAGKIYGNLGAF